MDPKQKRGCLWAAAGAAVLLVVVGVAVVAGGAWFVYQNFSLSVDHVTADSAGQTLDQVRARFAGQQPLLAIDDTGRAEVQARRTSTAGGTIDALHIASWEPDKGELARVSVPFWLLRLSGGKGRISLGDHQTFDLERTQLTVDDLERAGPGLILDHRERDGRHVLIWAE